MMRAFVTALLVSISIMPAVAETTFAEVDANGVVLRVIVADQKFIDSGRVGDPRRWVQTYPDGSVRKNYAGPGFIYDRNRDVFLPPKPFPSWALDEAKGRWESPIPMPMNGKVHRWNENARRWVVQAGE